jgi:pSer/pThr/pTyr-binding forkhead associated (FHA) protein
MKRVPAIVVQLVHIQGPLKGEIQEFSESAISVGRDPSNHVQFPKDVTIISRKHAEIVREGNRFRLLDHSANGTFLNGKKVEDAYLKDGDVLMFAEGGPKVSFLTKMTEGEPQIVSPPAPSPPREPEVPRDEKPPASHAQPEPRHADKIAIQRVQVTLVIQYGPTLQSFRELPITIGKNPNCGFILHHPAILDHHAQIFFTQEQYWVKDLTGQKLISINGHPVHLQAPLNPNDTLGFSPKGPNFRFLGGGRLAEVEQPKPKESLNAFHEKEETPSQKGPQDRGTKGPMSVFKKFLHR